MDINHPYISIVIVSWNSARHLPRCLDCLHAQTVKDFEIVLVDNNSTDGSIEMIKTTYSDLTFRVERLDRNFGFAAANNIGARLARGRWLVLLNADAFPKPNWLEKLVAAAQANPEIASFSSRQLQANDPNLLDGAGDVYHTSGLAWRRYIGYPAKRYGQEQMEVFSPCAAAAMYSREAFWEAGGFDEDFFSYFEDVDLGFRLQLKGFRCLYVPDAIVHHVGSSTFGGRSDFAFYHTHRNLIWTFIKDMPSKLLWRYLPAHVIANLVYLVYYTVLGRGRILWKAKWDSIRGLRKVISKRPDIQRHIRIDASSLARRMEHSLLQPYTLSHQRQKAMHIEGGQNREN